MRVLVLYAHPVETSYNAAVHQQVLEGLKEAGHEVDDLDLYAEGFAPAMTREERLHYHEPPENQVLVAAYCERLLAAEALVLVYPVWNFGFPAILKGYFDRVFTDGVSFEMTPSGIHTKLTNIKKITVVATYGASRLRAIAAGDPPRRVCRRWLWITARLRRPVQYVGLYDMNHNGPEKLAAFLDKVRRTMRAF